jgi:cation transport protein ChaC
LSELPETHERLDASERELLLSEEELDQSLALAIGKAPPGVDTWIFCYGSLMWNPIFPVAAAFPATIHGYHRSLCMNSIRGRGSIHNPGVLLGLDAGGACRGIVMKIGGDVPSELKLLWRREMMFGAYIPRWLDAKAGSGSIRSLCFVADRASEHYAGRLTDDEFMRRFATASGIYGTNRDYVQRTHKSLLSYGIHDVTMSRVLERQRLLGL